MVSEFRERSRSMLLALFLALVSVVLAAGLAMRVMNFEMRRDEQLYVPPIRLLADQQIYTDFFYNHVPGSAWLFHALATASGSDHLLATGRFGVLLGWVLMVAAVAGVTYGLTRSWLVAWCAVVLTFVNDLFLTQPGMTATNNFLPLPLSFLGLGLFVLGVRGGRARPLFVLASGLFLSLAVVMKVSAVAFIPAVALAALLVPRAIGLGARLVKVVLPLAVGGIVGGLPLLMLLATDRERFLAHVMRYHTGPHVRFWQQPGAQDEGAAVSSGAKLILAHDVWLAGGVAFAVAAVTMLLLIALRDRDKTWPPRRDGSPAELFAVALLAFGFAAVMSFVPTPGFPQYYAQPLICLPLMMAILFGSLGPEARGWAKPALLGLTVLVLVAGAPRLVQHLPKAASPGKWLVNRVHRDGVAIADALAKAGAAGKVATLAPVYPLEGGLSVYPELSTGPFAYRTADITDPEIAQYYRMTSPTRIGALFDAEPPAALLLGFYPDLEGSMRDWAAANGYRPVPDFSIDDRYGKLDLLVRSAGAAPAGQPPG
jgi:hypothetical protein